MLLKSEKAPDQTYLEDWPAHYYEISDIEVRGNCLNEVLRRNPDSADDKRRLQLYKGRFRKGRNGIADLYMRAWLDMQVTGSMSMNKWNRNKRMSDYRSSLQKFGLEDGRKPDELLLAEWRDFARTYIEACAESRSYRTSILGFVSMKDETVAKKIIKDILNTIWKVPQALGLGMLCEPLRDVMIRAYLEMVEHGDVYLKQAEHDLGL